PPGSPIPGPCPGLRATCRRPPTDPAATLAAPHFTGSEKWACGPIFDDRDETDADDTREGAPAAGRDRTAGRARPAGRGRPRGGAADPVALPRVRRPCRRGRPCPVQARHRRPARVLARVQRRSVLTGPRPSVAAAGAFRGGARPPGPASHGRAKAPRRSPLGRRAERE